jgi:hypothetical protein
VGIAVRRFPAQVPPLSALTSTARCLLGETLLFAAGSFDDDGLDLDARRFLRYDGAFVMDAGAPTRARVSFFNQHLSRTLNVAISIICARLQP